MNKLVTLLTLFLFSGQLRAQQVFELSGLEFRYSPAAQPVFSENAALNAVDYSFLEADFFINYANQLKGSTDYFLGLGFKSMTIVSDFPEGLAGSTIKRDFPDYLTNPENLFRASLAFGPIFQINNKWQLTTIAGAYISSDLESGLTGKDFVYDFTLLATKECNELKNFGVGAYLFVGRNRVLPFPVFSGYLATGPWEFAALLPLSLAVDYHFNKKHALSMDMEFDFGDFNLHSGNAPSSGLFTRAEGIEYQAFFMGLSYVYTLKEHWNLFAGLNYAYRDFNFITTNQDLGLTFENGSFINVGVAYIVF